MVLQDFVDAKGAGFKLVRSSGRVRHSRWQGCAFGQKKMIDSADWPIGVARATRPLSRPGSESQEIDASLAQTSRLYDLSSFRRTVRVSEAGGLSLALAHHPWPCGPTCLGRREELT